MRKIQNIQIQIIHNRIFKMKNHPNQVNKINQVFQIEDRIQDSKTLDHKINSIKIQVSKEILNNLIHRYKDPLMIKVGGQV